MMVTAVMYLLAHLSSGGISKSYDQQLVDPAGRFDFGQQVGTMLSQYLGLAGPGGCGDI